MNEIITTSTSSTLLVPAPRCGSIATRLATMNDLPFLDGLQKKHSKQLGFFPRAQMEGYVKGGWVLIAEADRGSGVGCRGSGEDEESVVTSFPKPETRHPSRWVTASPAIVTSSATSWA